ncbi:MAG: phospholipase D-like domain-containing protein [Enterococcus sp.]
MIKDPMLAMETKERLIIVSTSAICGIVAAQPIPFADAFILTPVQLLMVRYLAHLHGLDYKENTLRDILSQIVAVVGWGYLAQQGILGLYKTVIPFAGAVTTIPLVFSATGILGYTISKYFEYVATGKDPSEAELLALKKQTARQMKRELGRYSIGDIKNQVIALPKTAQEYGEFVEIFDKENDLRDEQDFQLLVARFAKYEHGYFSENFLQELFKLNAEQEFAVETWIKELATSEKQVSVGNRVLESNVYQLRVGDLYVYFIYNKNCEFLSIGDEESKAADETVFRVAYPAEERDYQLSFYGNDIYKRLEEVFRQAEYEIDIIAPFVNQNSFEKYFDACIEDALNRNVTVKILFGFGDGRGYSEHNDRLSKTKVAMRNIEKKFERFSNFVVKQDSTHIKAVIVDESYYFSGSLNIFSRGEIIKRANAEEEQMDQILDKDRIKAKRAELIDF